jgi:glycosyltransferase involved in cell wall biosynthesis
MSETKQEILTILVPTRDRADTLVHCLHTITSQTNPNIEIIVSDNFSGPEVKQVVDSITDPRLRYIRTPERLGMSEHWNWAVKHIKGDWVTIIGDDDGLLPNAVDKFFALHAKHPEIEAITCANCFYRWPSDKQSSAGSKLTMISGKGYEIRDCTKDLKSLMKGKVIFLPTIYTGGFVKKTIIDEVSKKSPRGEFFQSLIPDLYSQMAISSVTDKYIYSYEPWAIAGSSKHSNGRQHKNKTRAEIKKLPFHQEGNIKFNPKLGDGCVEAIQILFYESFLQSAHLRTDDMGITTQEQLEIAIIKAGRRIKQVTIEYCSEVAKLNNIEFEPIIRAVNRKKALYRINKLTHKFLKHIPGMSKLLYKDISATGVKNVYDASQKFKTLNFA